MRSGCQLKTHKPIPLTLPLTTQACFPPVAEARPGVSPSRGPHGRDSLQGSARTKVLRGTQLGEPGGSWAGGTNALNPAREGAQIVVETKVCVQTGAG